MVATLQELNIIDNEAKADISKYLELVQHTYDIDQAYLFGSHVNGTPHKWSDYDIAIVASEAQKDRHGFLVRLLSLARGIDTLIEPHPMTLDDLNDIYYPLGREVLKHGIRVI